MITSFGVAFATGFSLILAIGSQNAFVLRQGIRGQHVLPLVLFCGFSDAILIGLGVLGFGEVVTRFPALPQIMLVGAAIFLAIYGNLRLLAAWQGGQAIDDGQSRDTLWGTLALAAAFTWLNPHVYLDTLALMGSISLNYQPWPFFLGGAAASFTFFALLGFGARLLSPLLRTARAWRILDLLIGLTMWALVLVLLLK